MKLERYTALFSPLFFVFALVNLSSCGQAAPDTVPTGAEQLRQAIHDFEAAFARADVATLDTMITASYLHTTDNLPPIGKEEWLEKVRSKKEQIDKGLLAIDDYEMLDVKVRLYGQAAVVSNRIVVHGLENRAPFDAAYRTSQFWVVEEGRWKRAGFHDAVID